MEPQSRQGVAGDGAQVGERPTNTNNTGGGVTTSAALLASLARHAAGLGSRAYVVAAQRIIRGQQLRAARLLFGRRSPA